MRETRAAPSANALLAANLPASGGALGDQRHSHNNPAT